jgi:hypothetical protein
MLRNFDSCRAGSYWIRCCLLYVQNNCHPESYKLNRDLIWLLWNWGSTEYQSWSWRVAIVGVWRVQQDGRVGGELASAFELRSGHAENERETRMLCSRCRTTAELQPRQGCPTVQVIWSGSLTVQEDTGIVRESTPQNYDVTLLCLGEVECVSSSVR